MNDRIWLETKATNKENQKMLNNQKTFQILLGIFILFLAFGQSDLFLSRAEAEHHFNDVYTDQNLEYIAFPIGGFGSGMFCLEGNGTISHLSVCHQMDFFNEPTLFAAICIKGKTEQENRAKVLEGPIPNHKYFGRPGSALGSGERTYGLPRFTECQFSSRFPFCEILLQDQTLPLEVKITGFSPFIPNEADLSSFPAGSIDYSLTNQSTESIDAVFSLNARNFMGGDRFGELKNGFRVIGSEGEFALAIEGDETVYVDHCWFRGGWFDALTITWNNIQQGVLINNPPVENNAPGASLFVPVKLAPNETKTIRLLTAWFVPQSNLSITDSLRSLPLDNKPASGTANNQSLVSGYTGNKLVNTYYPNGDAHRGKIVSPEFKIDRKYLHFQIGGGNLNGVGVSLLQKENDGSFRKIQTLRGNNNEQLSWATWNLDNLQGQTVQIEILDNESGPWGHINADQFILTDSTIKEFLADDNPDNFMLLADFENENYENWKVELFELSNEFNEQIPSTYSPWYATQFQSVENLLDSFAAQYEELRKRSETFAQTLKSSTLPPELLEAIEANLTILKSTTILRQQDGRLWGWEGNQDFGGSCAGTCSHVWNYSQSLCHLFPALERTFRQTEFHESLTPEGRQAFRANLPIASEELPGTLPMANWEALCEFIANGKFLARMTS